MMYSVCTSQGGEEGQANTDEPSTASSSRQIVTSEDELRCFALVKVMFDGAGMGVEVLYDSAARKESPAAIAYKDTTGYFGIYINKPSWWVIRLSIEGKKKWVGFNIDKATAEGLIPAGMALIDPSAFSAVRVQIESPDDLEKLKPIVLAAIRRAIDEHRTGAK
jgi:hypothetical protein